MKITERIIWLAALIVLIAVLLITRSELNNMREWVDKQNEQLMELDNLIDEVLTDASSGSDETDSGTDQITEFEIRRLTQSGLDNPISDLKKDLIERADLIQFDGILGGTMRIPTTESVTILYGGWAYAVFEDGHINGGMLLEYEVENGKITWKVLHSKLF